jgi:hypothetical protein
MRGDARGPAADAIERGQLGIRRIVRRERCQSVRRRLRIGPAYARHRPACDNHAPRASPEANDGT